MGVCVCVCVSPRGRSVSPRRRRRPPRAARRNLSDRLTPPPRSERAARRPRRRRRRDAQVVNKETGEETKKEATCTSDECNRADTTAEARRRAPRCTSPASPASPPLPPSSSPSPSTPAVASGADGRSRERDIPCGAACSFRAVARVAQARARQDRPDRDDHRGQRVAALGRRERVRRHVGGGGVEAGPQGVCRRRVSKCDEGVCRSRASRCVSKACVEV